MDLQTLTYIVVGGTFALYLGIAFWAPGGLNEGFLRRRRRHSSHTEWYGNSS